jgi:hypothetical protein
MGTMLILGVFGTLCYSFRKILESSYENELEKYRIDSNERMCNRYIEESKNITKMERDTALLNYMKSRQEIAFFQGEFEEAASLKYEYDNLHKRIRGSSRD